MRYVFGFLFVCGLGVVPVAGCSWDLGDWDWNYNPCEGVVCPDDGNECTEEYCSLGKCELRPAENGTECTYDGLAGVCVSGECGENRCEGVVCDDENACTDDHCDYVDGSCYFTPIECYDENQCADDACDPAEGCTVIPVEDGTLCSEGVCTAGACVLPTDACTNIEDLAIVCDPSFMEEVEACGDPAGAFVAPCLVENTGVSPDCASCYGTAVRCIVENCLHVCAPTPESQECEDCYVENGCIALLDECTGDLESACDGRDAMSGVGMFEAQP